MVYPIKGKVANSFRTSKAKMFENTEIQGLIKCTLDGPYRKDFDPYKDVPWEKIIIMADSDVDGAHISVLVSSFFLMYMPQIIQAGKLYRAVPPLYSIPKGKKGDTYFTQNIDYINYLQKEFMKYNAITTIDDKPIPAKDILYFFNLNQDYVYYVNSVAQTCAVDPEILEIALFNHYNKTSMTALKKDIKSKYRFMDVTKENNTTIVKGTTTEANMLFMNDFTIKLCEDILKLLDKNKNFYYKFNGEIVSIYTIMKAFENTRPDKIQRYKGLGEMDADQIAISTLRPDSDRMLIRYTIEDIKNEIAAIDKYNDNFTQLFKFVGEVSRRDLLD